MITIWVQNLVKIYIQIHSDFNMWMEQFFYVVILIVDSMQNLWSICVQMSGRDGWFSIHIQGSFYSIMCECTLLFIEFSHHTHRYTRHSRPGKASQNWYQISDREPFFCNCFFFFQIQPGNAIISIGWTMIWS